MNNKFVTVAPSVDLARIDNSETLLSVVIKTDVGFDSLELDPQDFDDRVYDDGEYILAEADFDVIDEAIARLMPGVIRDLSLYEQMMTMESAVRQFEAMEEMENLMVLFTPSP